MSEDKKESKILLVDDVQVNLDQMKDALFQAGNYQIAVAKNGKTALAKAKANKFDLILLDIIMPDIDGFEVCETLKNYHSTKNVPVIFLTSKNDPESISKGFRIGAVDYISKPFSYEELQARVKLHLRLKHTQEELFKAKVIAEEAAHAKSLFLANMSHEIRTPMNGIIGMIDILKQTPLNNKQKEFLDIVDVSGGNLLTIINDILDFSKIESGKIELEKIDFSVSKELNEVLKLLDLKAREKSLPLKLQINSDVPEFINGDPVRLKQIIINLINNAIKFTKEGSVTISVEVDEIINNKIKLLCKVIDTGIGISEEGMNKLFKSFSQTDSSTTRKYGGTGLGLAISKKLSRLMNGSIGVKSEEGKGSTFWFTAEFETIIEKQNTKIPESHINVQDNKKLKVLLAEDNTINQKVASFNFNKIGHHVDIAENGEIAVEKYLENDFDMIFMDIQMPVMDGIQATEKIRKIEKEKNIEKQIVIIAMTANIMKGDKEKYLAVGMDGFIGKPFKQNELISVIDKFSF